MVVEPRKKRTFLYIVAGITLIEACVGLAVVISIHVISEPKFEISTNNDVNFSTTASPTTTTSLPVSITTPSNSSSLNHSIPTDTFKRFIENVRTNVELYTGKKEYTAWFATYTALDAIWIFAILDIFVAAHNIPNNYKHLLPYIFVTAIICVTDLVTTTYFTIFLLSDEGFDPIKNMTNVWEQFALAVSKIFIPVYCSKIGIYWIINVIFLIKMQSCYKLFKEKYDNPFGKDLDSSYDLQQYDDEDDNSMGYENTGYTENVDKSNWSFQPPSQNGQAVRGYKPTQTATRENSIGSTRSSNSNNTSLPPPKVIGKYAKVNINDRLPKRIEDRTAQNKANLANRRATGYYVNNELPIRNSIANTLDLSDDEDAPDITIPVTTYNKLPDDKLEIPRVRLV